MGKLHNRATIPQGMLAPSGLEQAHINPDVQATVRPGGTLLHPSPGYDSIRIGKNIFQGRGHSGGFRAQEFAEELGGTGAALSVTPGYTTAVEASEWLPEGTDSLPEGTMIISDRVHEPGFATRLHQAYGTIPDMGDRHPERPLSRALTNPFGMIRQDYHEHPVVTVLAAAAFVGLVKMVGTEFERGFARYRRGGPVTTVTAAPAAAAETGGNVAADTVDAIGEAGNKAVQAIEDAGKQAVDAIKDTADDVKSTVTGGGNGNGE